MLFIRTAKAMVISETTIAMLVLALLLLSTSTEVIGAERIPDSELASLYGGCWFYNPYCIVQSPHCPAHTECDGFHKCRFCEARIGEICQDRWGSWIPDFDGCDDGTGTCLNSPWLPNGGLGIPQVWGECLQVDCIEELYDYDYIYPNCNVYNYNWCDD